MRPDTSGSASTRSVSGRRPIRVSSRARRPRPPRPQRRAGTRPPPTGAGGSSTAIPAAAAWGGAGSSEGAATHALGERDRRESGDARSGSRNSREYVGTAPPSAIPAVALRSRRSRRHPRREVEAGSRSWSATSETSTRPRSASSAAARGGEPALNGARAGSRRRACRRRSPACGTRSCPCPGGGPRSPGRRPLDRAAEPAKSRSYSRVALYFTPTRRPSCRRPCSSRPPGPAAAPAPTARDPA